MKLSSRSRYGFRAILALALNYGKGPIQIKVIAREEGISSKYLEQLIALFKVNGLVNSIRGSKGGYMLAQKPSEIKLSEIFSALEGTMSNVNCTNHSKFSKGCCDCVVSIVLSKFNKNIQDYFESMTLQDMVDSAEGKNNCH